MTRSQSRVSISTVSKPKSWQSLNSQQFQNPKSPQSRKLSLNWSWHLIHPGLQRLLLLILFTFLPNWNIHEKNKQTGFSTSLRGYRVIHVNLTSFKLYVWLEYIKKEKQLKKPNTIINCMFDILHFFNLTLLTHMPTFFNQIILNIFFLFLY